MRRAALLLALAAAPAMALPIDRLESLVGNRVAGAPIACIEANEIEDVYLVAGGLVYGMRSPGTMYLNRPATGAR